MRRTLGGLLLVALIGGCAQTHPGAYDANVASDRGYGGLQGQAIHSPKVVSGAMGPYGQPIPRFGGAPQTASSAGEAAARKTFEQGLPAEIVQQITLKEDAQRAGGANMGILRTGGPIPGQPGPTAMPGIAAPRGSGLPGAVAAIRPFDNTAPAPATPQRTAIRFARPNGMRIAWQFTGEDGKAKFTEQTLTVPASYNFRQAAIYRLKLTNIPGRPGVALYPTMEVVPSNKNTARFLSHSSVPMVLTRDDFDQVMAGNYLVKVIYLPFPQFQDPTAIGINEVSSARLEPGQDPIAEAKRRGHILLVLRMGNINLETIGAPGIDAPPPGGNFPGGRTMPPSIMMGPNGPIPTPGMMANRGAMPPGMPGMGGMPMMPPPPGMSPVNMGGRMAPYGAMPPQMMGARPGGMLPNVSGNLPVPPVPPMSNMPPAK